MFKHIVGAILLLAAVPAHAANLCPAGDTKRWVVHALNVADKGITHVVTRRGHGVEANPLWTPVMGKRISLGEAAAMTAISSGLFELSTAGLRRRGDCRRLDVVQSISIAIQGGVVAANLRFVF